MQQQIVLMAGDTVEKLGSPYDYTTGRTGLILGSNIDVTRWQVKWMFDKHGNRIADGVGVRTWVKPQFLKKITPF